MSYTPGVQYDEQADAFAGELDQLVDRFRNEFDLLDETMVGILHARIVALSTPTEWDLGDDMLD